MKKKKHRSIDDPWGVDTPIRPDYIGEKFDIEEISVVPYPSTPIPFPSLPGPVCSGCGTTLPYGDARLNFKCKCPTLKGVCTALSAVVLGAFALATAATLLYRLLTSSP